MKMLIVDDVMTNSAIMKRMAMRVFDGEIDLVVSASEAVEACKTNLYDLIVTDYMMPEVDGLELVAIIRQLDGHKQTPIIMASACHEPQLLNKAKAVGINNFIAKPIDMETFRKMIDRIANGALHATKSQNVYIPIKAA